MKFFAMLAFSLFMFVPQVSAAPGDLLSYEPMASSPSDANAWRITYETRDGTGRVTRSTGLVIVPRGAPANDSKRNVIAWQHGTVGIRQECSPSASDKPFEEIPALAAILDNGYAIVATDYPGLGAGGPHAYLGGRDAANAVLDGIRAAQEIREANVGDRYALWGHSQGGHASLWAGQLRHYAPELQLTSVVAASPPTLLSENIHELGALERGILTAYVLQSWSDAYGLSMEEVISKSTEGIVGRATASCLGGSGGLAQLIRVIALSKRLGDVDLTKHSGWRSYLVRNTPGMEWSGIPLMVVSADKDPIISDEVTRSYVDQVRRRGANVTLVPLNSKDHGATAKETGVEALRFINENFRPRPRD